MQTVDFTHFPLASGDLVLDLGCGEGRHVISAYLEAEVHSIGVDLSLDDLKTTRDKFSDFAEPDNEARSFGLSSANALELPFADNTFDKVICSEVLEHIPDYRGALNEIQRVLKPGGLFCASVPRRWPEKICWALSEELLQYPRRPRDEFSAGSELRRRDRGDGSHPLLPALGARAARPLSGGSNACSGRTSRISNWLVRPVSPPAGLGPVGSSRHSPG